LVLFTGEIASLVDIVDNSVIVVAGFRTMKEFLSRKVPTFRL